MNKKEIILFLFINIFLFLQSVIRNSNKTQKNSSTSSSNNNNYNNNMQNKCREWLSKIK